MQIDREQKLQLQRSGAYGYQWAISHRGELSQCTGQPEVCDFLARSPEFVRGLPRCPMGRDLPQQMVQLGRCHRAAVAGVLRALSRMGVALLPF